MGSTQKDDDDVGASSSCTSSATFCNVLQRKESYTLTPQNLGHLLRANGV